MNERVTRISAFSHCNKKGSLQALAPVVAPGFVERSRQGLHQLYEVAQACHSLQRSGLCILARISVYLRPLNV